MGRLGTAEGTEMGNKRADVHAFALFALGLFTLQLALSRLAKFIGPRGEVWK